VRAGFRAGRRRPPLFAVFAATFVPRPFVFVEVFARVGFIAAAGLRVPGRSFRVPRAAPFADAVDAFFVTRVRVVLADLREEADFDSREEADLEVPVALRLAMVDVLSEP
jgi:hypothetical protein